MKAIQLRSLLIAVMVIVAATCGAQAGEKGLVAHEWGTFTSVQGGDGELISWRPLQTSQLPGFVYAWNHPGAGHKPVLALGKGAMNAFQRLETPVIYFYADETTSRQTVDVSVSIPKGRITEWYPQASSVGPMASLTFQPNAYAEPGFIRWSGVRVMPPQAKALLISDASGSHYFAARHTDANYVRDADNPAETEKFLFYRGVGNFTTPLNVTMKSDDSVMLKNTGKDTLSHLFLLGIQDKAGNFICLPELKPGEETVVPINTTTMAPPQLTKSISENMAQALVKSGLYKHEAEAMVNTWKDSWFSENGLRVLYILPRAWTDQTLPMEIKPQPKELVRVMVGRAEILRPGLEHFLASELEKAKGGDAAASEEVKNSLRSLGRFAEPAFYRAYFNAKPQAAEQGRLLVLLSESGNPN